jgi:hypothetical protein
VNTIDAPPLESLDAINYRLEDGGITGPILSNEMQGAMQ